MTTLKQMLIDEGFSKKGSRQLNHIVKKWLQQKQVRNAISIHNLRKNEVLRELLGELEK